MPKKPAKSRSAAGPTPDPLAQRCILVGVTGGIAAYKSAILVSMLVQRRAEVRVVMTDAAERFVAPLTFQTLTGRPVHRDMWAAGEAFNSAHISLADWADACVVAPATANVIAQMACGLAQDLLSTTVLALDVPVLVAPAMNTRMWRKPVVEDNVALLRKRGYAFVGPAEGRLACGDTGPGRMSEPGDIVVALELLITGKKPRRKTRPKK
jgi:phosphopantothenoylcysteine decarboxylase/phosphopantothenate--cysteine ligase